MLRLAVLVVLACVPGINAHSQEDDPGGTVTLVAAPRLVDPDYRGAVLLAVPVDNNRHVGVIINRWTGPAPDGALQRREWWHAFWWSAVPNLLLLITVWVMIQEAR